ncbi:MAG: hypothetical protein ABSA44_09820 [Bacteroidota bacterium]|jgi:hypothetical protein
MKKIYSKEMMIDAILKNYNETGRIPQQEEWNASNRHPCRELIHRSFGSFNNAITAAGLIPRTYWVSIPKDIMIERLRVFAKKLGRSPCVQEMDCLRPSNVPCRKTYEVTFGGFKKALLAAGLKPPEYDDIDPSERDTILFALRIHRFIKRLINLFKIDSHF